MSDPDYRALCAELLVALKSWSPHGGGPLECWQDREEEAALIARAEAALAQPEPVADLAAKLLAESKPMDPEMAAVLTTEARWDLYEGSPTPQPEPVAPTNEELLELMPEEMRDDLAELSCIAAQHHGLKPGIFRVVLNTNVMAYARAVLARWGTPANNTNYDHE